jgi:thioredoxin reductase (NADPH)
VTLVHRRDKLRSEKILQDKLFAKEKAGKVTIRWNCTLDEVLGDAVRRHRHADREQLTNEPEVLPLMGVFIAIGHKPNTDLFIGQLAMEGGYLLTRCGHQGNATATSVAGVFAAGDVQDHIYRQACTSAAAAAWRRSMPSATSTASAWPAEILCRRFAEVPCARSPAARMRTRGLR